MFYNSRNRWTICCLFKKAQCNSPFPLKRNSCVNVWLTSNRSKPSNKRGKNKVNNQKFRIEELLRGLATRCHSRLCGNSGIHQCNFPLVCQKQEHGQ